MVTIDVNDFEVEKECYYQGEKYIVRDNGAVLRYPKDDGQAQNEGRGQDGQGGDGLQKALAGDVCAGDGIGEDVADEGGDHCHDHSQHHGAAERL